VRKEEKLNELGLFSLETMESSYSDYPLDFWLHPVIG